MAFQLTASERTVKGEKMRTRTVIPAVVYGSGSEPVSLSLSYDEFLKLYKEAGGSSLIDLMISGKESGKVLIKDIQRDPVSDKIIHVDLKKIDMNKPITATVALKFTNEAPVIKEQGGTLMHNIGKVEVKCLPKDLPAHIDIDLSVLKTFDDVIKVKNLNVPTDVEVVNPHAEDLVAKVVRALTEEEIKAMEAVAAPADLAQIEVAGKKKDEEGAEGEEAEKEKGVPEKKEEKKEEKK